MRPVFLAALALLAAGSAQAQPARPPAAPASSSLAIRADPAVRRGVLPNGLRYAVMRNAQPAQGVSIRMNVRVGSFEEGDDEQGIAHFLEHMAFNGTRSIAEDELDRVFAAQGVAFGKDQNASTGHFDTTYYLDLPLADAAKLDLGFRWMREIGDGMVLSPEAVNRERGVVLAEHDRALSPARSFAEAQAVFRAPELRGPTRWPIGTRAVLGKIDAGGLRRFYDRWYRPQNAAVVVVGDAPVAELERRVIQAFGSWRGRGEAPRRAVRRAPVIDRGLDVLVSSEPQLPTAVSACRPRPRDPDRDETPGRWRDNLRRGLWEGILNERLQRLSRAASPPYVAAAVSYSDAYREAAYSCLSVTPLNDDWRRGLNSALTEVRRMELHGVTPEEVRRAVTQRRTAYRAAAASAETRHSAALAGGLLSDLSEETVEVFSRPEENLRLFEAAVAGLGPAEVDQAFRRDWSGGGPLITLRAPQAPPADTVRAAWAATMASAAPSKPVDEARKAWAYTDFGPAGRVTRRETVVDPGFTRLTFENGLVMNFKRVAFTRDRVDVSVRLGAGRSGLPYESPMPAMLAAQLLTTGGLGRHDLGDLTWLFQDRQWSVGFTLDSNWYGLGGSTSPADLGLQMQVLAAFLTDPGFRTNADAKIPTSVETLFRTYRSSPGLMMSLAMGEAAQPGGPFGLPPREVLAGVRSADFERLLKPVLTTAPLEVTVVGDVEEARAIEAVAATLGALPRRDGPAAPSVRPPFIRFPAQLPEEIRVVHEGAPEKALVGVVWPLYVAVPQRRREEYALQLLEGVFQDALRRRVREALGKSYSPSVSLSMPDYADQGTLSAMVETSPADAEAVAIEIRKLAADLAAGGVSAAAVEDVRKPLLEGRAKQRETNGWWLSALDGSAQRPEWLKDAVQWERLIASLSREEVQAAASAWLTRPAITAFATPAPAVASSAGKAVGGS